MKRILLVLLALFLAACQGTATPPPTTLPASVTPKMAEPPTVAPPPSKTVTTLPPTEVPTETPLPQPDATSFPNPDNYSWEIVVSGLSRPVNLKNASDERLFIIEKIGRIRVVQDGSLLDSPFLNIEDRVGGRGNEQGLLGLAFHPNYAESGLF